MKYEYDSELDETRASIDGVVFATIDGEVTRWRNGIPHTETGAYQTFSDGLLQLDTPREREVILHLMAADIEKVGFD